MDNLEHLILDLKESLEREIHALGRGLREEIHHLGTRFDNQAMRLDRQGALLVTGSRWTSRMNDWAEKIDTALEVKDREISELRTRLDRLESGRMGTH